MYDLLENIAYDYAYAGEIEKAAILSSYSDLYNMMVNFNHAAPLVALDAIKELQREYRNMSYAEKQEVLQNYFDLWMD